MPEKDDETTMPLPCQCRKFDIKEGISDNIDAETSGQDNTSLIVLGPSSWRMDKPRRNFFLDAAEQQSSNLVEVADARFDCIATTSRLALSGPSWGERPILTKLHDLP
jgi:hypothetical protein